MQNPLLESWNTPYECIPFDHIKEEHFLPALKEAIQIRNNNLERIKNEKSISFQTIIEALEKCSHKMDLVATIFFNLLSAKTNDKMDAIAKVLAPLLTEAQNDLTLDLKIFSQIEEVYKNKKNENLTPEQDRLLEKYYKNFVRNGAKLNDNEKKHLRSCDKKLSELSVTFSENTLKETNEYFLHLTQPEEIKGIPEGALEAAHEAAKEKKLDGWVFTLHYPSYGPFMQYAENEELRKKLYLANGKKAHQSNKYKNDSHLKEIALIRHKRAQLLGYRNHAHYVLEDRMALNEKNVMNLLQQLLKKAKPAALKELEEVKSLKKETTGESKFHPWDYSFYLEKLTLKKFNLSDEILKPYFKLENVIGGAFLVASKLYGLDFKKTTSIPTYHPDVETYEVFDQDSQKFIGLFYTDFFPRESKRAGAWMTSYRDQYSEDEIEHRPHISIVCNFTKPTQTKPSLLTLNEVLTLFHEFGHSLHGLLSQCKYKSLSGTNVLWDFVELPSQLMENWVYEKECLDLFAKHYETNESIPMELIHKIKEMSNFHEGIATLRQVSLGLLDMSWHTTDVSMETDVEKFERNAIQECTLMPPPEGVVISTSFSHIFSGGYSSGYYSYKWAEVLDADIFEYFKEEGLFNKKIADQFKNTILSKGDSKHPMELYKEFRGREPSVDPLLKRAGLI